MRTLLLTSLLLVLSGCASTGPVIENDRLAELQKGKTTQAEILRRFGRPSFHSDNMDGTKTSAYLQAGTRSNAVAMVSLVGALASGGRANANAVIFRFDANSVLESYERTAESVGENSMARNDAGSATPAAPGSPAASGTVPAARPAAPPRPARTDNLPDWLPSSSTKDPRNPHPR